MIQTGGRTLMMMSLVREGYGKDKHWVLLRLLSRDSALLQELRLKLL